MVFFSFFKYIYIYNFNRDRKEGLVRDVTDCRGYCSLLKPPTKVADEINFSGACI